MKHTAPYFTIYGFASSHCTAVRFSPLREVIQTDIMRSSPTFATQKLVQRTIYWSSRCSQGCTGVSGGLRVGGGEARLKRGSLWWRHHIQSSLIRSFDQVKEVNVRVTRGYVPDTTGMTDITENAKGYLWYTTLKTLIAGKIKLATQK